MLSMQDTPMPEIEQTEAAIPEHGQGRGEIKRICRPKTQRFRMLSLLWVFPSAGALLIMVLDAPSWMRLSGLTAQLAAVPLQSWLALGILITHGVFLGLARHYHRSEPWQEITFSEPSSGVADAP